MDSVIIFVAKYFFIASIIITGWFWLVSRRDIKVELLVRAVVGGVLALLLSMLVSHVYYDPRPFVVAHIKPLIPHAADNGFPSDHALLTSFLAFLVMVYSRKVGSVLFIIAVLVGASRVAAHVHHSLDIVASFVISAIVVAVVSRIITTQRVRSLRDRGAKRG